MTTNLQRRWEIFAKQSFLDIKLWFFVLLIQLLWHIVFLLVILPDVEYLPTLNETVLASFNAFRFDSRVAAVFTFFSWLCISLVSTFLARDTHANLIRCIWLVFIWLFVCIANLAQIGYYDEYHTTFDFNLFALVYDDFNAILATIYQEYNLPLYLFVLLVIAIAGSVILIRYFRRQLIIGNLPPLKLSKNLLLYHGQGIVLLATMLIAMLIVVRGATGIFPLQYMHIAVTRDALINQATLNPFNAFAESYSKHIKTLGDRGIERFSSKPIETIAKRLFPGKTGTKLDDFTSNTAKGTPSNPRHIFLLVLESYSSWPLLDKYSDLKIASGLKKLSEHPSGVLFVNFLPSSSGTMTSFASMITGMQDVSVFTNYQQQSETPYATSLPAQFTRMGYRTRFFYGGSDSWHDVGRFLSNQGVDEIHSWADIAAVNNAQVWGLPDGELYDYVLQQLDDSVPSLNIIMSISFHPPYTLDLASLGVDTSITDAIIKNTYPDSVDSNTLGHWKYADKEMYRFITTVEKKLGNSLFVVTGDHYANNKHLLDKPPLYETTSVPLLLYGRMLSDIYIDNSVPGTHLDIAPTLIELSAHAGFTYNTIGKNLLSTSRNIAISSKAVISREFVARIEDLPKATSIVDSRSITIDSQTSNRIMERFNLAGAYSWWRIVKGNSMVAE